MPALPACCTPSQNASAAERAYCAYNSAGDPATAGLNYAGKPCPTWADLPENIREKWEAAATVAGDWDEPINDAAAQFFEERGVASVKALVSDGDAYIEIGTIEVDLGGPALSAGPVAEA